MMRVTVKGNPQDPTEYVRNYHEEFDAVGFELRLDGSNVVRVTPAGDGLTKVYSIGLYHVKGVPVEG